MKRKMMSDEKIIIELILACGCMVDGCHNKPQFHHIPMARPNALAIGFGLCDEHHTGMAFPGQSVHSNRMLFCGKYGSELELLQKALIMVFKTSISF